MSNALDYVVRDRMGKVVSSHDGHGAASTAAAKLDPGAFVAKGTTILGWHPATSKSMQRDVRDLIGWPAEGAGLPTPERPAGAQFVFGAPSKSRAVPQMPAVAQAAPARQQRQPIESIEQETMMTKARDPIAMCAHPGCKELRARARAVTAPHLAALCREHRLAKLAEEAKTARASAPEGRGKKAAKKPSKPSKSKTTAKKAPKAASASSKRVPDLDDFTIADALDALEIVRQLGGLEAAADHVAFVAKLTKARG